MTFHCPPRDSTFRFQPFRRRPPKPSARRLAVLASALLGAALALGACVAAETSSYVFVANFYPSPVSLRIGPEPGTVFSVLDLAAGEISPLIRVRGIGAFPVEYKPAGQSDWQRLPSELAGEGFRIEGDTVTAVVIDRRGFIRAATLADDERPGARLCLLNGANAKLSSAAVSAAGAMRGEAQPEFWTKNLTPGAATRFFSVAPGAYHCAAVFSQAPSALGGGDRKPTVVLDADLSCAESSYWLLYGVVRNDSIVLEKRLLAVRDHDRLVPSNASR